MGSASSVPAPSAKPFIVIVGGSFCGQFAAQKIAKDHGERYKVVVIERNSHYEYLFAFTRFAVYSGLEARKAFVPFMPGTFYDCPANSGTVVQAIAVDVDTATVHLDRPVLIDGIQYSKVPYAFLVIATGTRMPPPNNLLSSEKGDGVAFLDDHARKVRHSQHVVFIGAGACGVQMATDTKEAFPHKRVTLLHSRQQTMNRFLPRLDEIVKQRCEELGIELVLGERAMIPQSGFPNDGSIFEVTLQSGKAISCDLAVSCTGQRPRSQILARLSPQSIMSDGSLSVLGSLQIADAKYPHIFTLGDVADTGAPKQAWAGWTQANVISANIGHLLANELLQNHEHRKPGLRLTLGLHKTLLWSEDDVVDGQPKEEWYEGPLDRNIQQVWESRHGGPDYDA